MFGISYWMIAYVLSIGKVIMFNNEADYGALDDFMLGEKKKKTALSQATLFTTDTKRLNMKTQ